MSRDNETSQESWDEPEEDSNEGETHLQKRSRPFRSDSGDSSARQRQAHGSPEKGRNRPGYYEGRSGRRPGPNRAYETRQDYDAYGRPRRNTRSSRDAYEYTTEPPRERTRQSHDFEERIDPYDEIDEKYHQQHRMSRRSRAEAEARQRQRLRQHYYAQDEVNDVYMRPQQRYRPVVDPEIQEFD